MSSTYSDTADIGSATRSDALRNRERILSVAHGAFSDDPDSR